MGQDRNMNNCELASPILCPSTLQRIGLCPVSIQLSWQRTIAHFTVSAFSGHRKVSLTALEPCHPDSSSRTILLLVMLRLSHSTEQLAIALQLLLAVAPLARRSSEILRCPHPCNCHSIQQQ